MKVKSKIYGVDVREREVRDGLKVQDLRILKKRGRLWGTQAWDYRDQKFVWICWV